MGNFEEIREEGYYYVDKSEYIRTLEDYKVPVFLRPRRFGKTLWCSTLECYYDINRKEKFDSIFGDLAIGKNPTGNQNRYMVMRLNFSKFQVEMDMTKLEKNFRDIYQYALESFLAYSEFKNQKTIIEFKYFKKSEKATFKKLKEALNDDLIQVERYAADTVGQFPQYSVKTAVIYVCANEEFKFFKN